MRLKIYKLYENSDLHIRPATVLREWMDNTPQSFAYRCLPLNIANTHGWEILSPISFDAEWNGTPDIDGITIDARGPEHIAPVSHFGSGVLTFHVPAIFRTEEDYNLYVSGPINDYKDGIVPLTGIIETDWSPYSFTMNWKFTRPHHKVTFKAGETFCSFFVIPRGLVEKIEPEILPATDDPEMLDYHKNWSIDRDEFNTALHNHESEAEKKKWQKLYYRGLLPDLTQGCPAHQIKLRVKEVEEKKKDK